MYLAIIEEQTAASQSLAREANVLFDYWSSSGSMMLPGMEYLGSKRESGCKNGPA
ncbi:hypothetical protein QA646_20635 (plasmid) [Rhizobium sp. CB3090]|uniref:hypothetical protein n=1 Tax=Rhizobium sp. CB3090 TaxID=3039156 RepID=UPI0024B246E4|nr:hypothetical protein [Rhizobium sp. CB3090]WFU12324.1 hypothetical protein QA646_20635 [Rhizobium sp. CB3090]